MILGRSWVCLLCVIRFTLLIILIEPITRIPPGLRSSSSQTSTPNPSSQWATTNSSHRPPPTAPPNPLTLDKLTAFSRKLLNIAFTLYWREDQTNVQEGGVSGVNLKWEGG